MASPQKENGYTAIANETMDALAKTRIPGEVRQVLDFILRKTYGWNKKSDQISLSQFVEGTGLTKVHVCRSINILKKMNIVTQKGNAKSLFTKKGNDIVITYDFQKNYAKWVTLPKKVTCNPTLPKKVKLPKKVTCNASKIKETLPILGTTKETNTKAICKHPSIEEFVKYITDNKLNISNPEGLYAGYADGGWIDTQGNPVRNWKLKLRTLHNMAAERRADGQKLTPPAKLDSNGLTARQKYLKQQGDPDYLKG